MNIKGKTLKPQNSTLGFAAEGEEMEQEKIGLAIDVMKVFVAIGSENYAVDIVKDSEHERWCIRMRTNQSSAYYIQKQRGGIRTFSHLEDAMRHVVGGFDGIKNLVIHLGDKEFFMSGTDLSKVVPFKESE